MKDLYEAAAKLCTVDEFLVLAAEEKDVHSAVRAACHADRYDILEALKDHERYGKDATDELNIKNYLAKMDKEWKEKCEKYPPIFKKWMEVLHKTSENGIFDVSYPAQTANAAGLNADDYVAISGDGLFMFMLKIVTMEGNGLFEPYPHPPTPTYPIAKPSRDELAFLHLGKCKYGDQLTGSQVTEILYKVYPPR